MIVIFQYLTKVSDVLLLSIDSRGNEDTRWIRYKDR